MRNSGALFLYQSPVVRAGHAERAFHASILVGFGLPVLSELGRDNKLFHHVFPLRHSRSGTAVNHAVFEYYVIPSVLPLTHTGVNHVDNPQRTVLFPSALVLIGVLAAQLVVAALLVEVE